MREVGDTVNPLPPPEPAVTFKDTVAVLDIPESVPKPTKLRNPPKLVGSLIFPGSAVMVITFGVVKSSCGALNHNPPLTLM